MWYRMMAQSLNDIQHATKKDLKIIWNINGVYDVARFGDIQLLLLPFRKRKSEASKMELQRGHDM